MNEWQPIETAPKDGTHIRVRVGNWAPYYAYWKAGAWQPIEFDGPYHPTHWMPLSEPPK